ncbi:lysozyme inhibitor LprI family protein [Snodgrassella sp. CFCC 13594]|uniref:lysozyme inhibitor LprI family protein n=1 Tax=Snodgrassella sp. CFCC 13594 TaxID=1775559 RepID=UPI00082A0C3F|nr:lysozyme inhibitor LprI family protein [Snodgrassella sp. CFCC 13594]
MDKPSMADELARLFELYEKGALTKEEYEQQKAIVLAGAQHKEPVSPHLSEDDTAKRNAVLPAVSSTAAPSQPPMMAAPAKNNTNIVLMGLGIIALAAIGVVVWLYNQPKALPNPVVTAASAASEAHQASERADGLSPEALQKALFDAKQTYTTADTQLNTVWSELDDDLKSVLKSGQASWIRQKQADCTQAPNTSAAEAEVDRLTCETNMINERIDALQTAQVQMLPKVKAAKLAAVDAQSDSALSALGRTWNALPETVQEQLGQDFDQWAKETNDRCADASSSDSQVQIKIDYNMCLINAVKAKNNELKGYKI